MPDQRQNAWVKDSFEVDPDSFATAGAAPAASSQSRSSSSFGDSILQGLKTVGDAVAAGATAAGGAIATGVVGAGEAIAAGAVAVGGAVASGAQAVGGAVADGAVALASGRYDKAMQRLDAQIKAVKQAGLNETPYAAQAASIREEYAEAQKRDLSDRLSAVSALGTKAETVAGEAEADIARLKKSAVEGVSAAVTGMRDGAKALIDKLPKDNPAQSKTQGDFAKRLADLDTSIADAGKLTDRAERAKALKTLNKTAQTLFDEASNASSDKSTIQAVYAKALQDRYGFSITNPSNMPNTHLDQVYKMFDKVPEADVVQNKMQTLTYEPLDDKGKKNSGAAYGGATIFMGDYGKEDWGYTDPKTGKPAPANGFSISTLHELGHSVDDRFKIMDASQGKDGGGGWRRESIDSVAKAFIDEFKTGTGKSVKIDDPVLSTAVKAALSGAGAKQPPGLGKPEWAVLKPMLDLCVSRRNDAWPWGHPHDIKGRAYHESYANDWWSYAMSVRAKPLTVRDYQWRAPGEWFAELYAYSYFKSEAPPAGVDAAITAYMFGGKAAAAAAPGS